MSPDKIQPKSQKMSPAALMRQASDAVKLGLSQVSRLLSVELQPNRAAEVYKMITDEWEKPLKDIRETARAALLNFAEENGEACGTGNKSRAVPTDDFTVKKQVSLKQEPELKGFRALLAAKKIPEKGIIVEVIEYKVDMLQVDALIRNGKLTQEEVDALRPIHQIQLRVERK